MIQERIITGPKSSITKICNRFDNLIACVDMGSNNWKIVYDDGVGVPLEERLATIRQQRLSASPSGHSAEPNVR